MSQIYMYLLVLVLQLHPEEKQLKINKNHIESIRNINESLVKLKFLILIWHNINLKLIILIWKQYRNNIFRY